MMKAFKMVLYVLLLIAEAIVGFLLLSLAWANTFEIPSILIGIVCAALLVWQLVMLIKAPDAKAKGKIRRNLALILLIPIAAFIVMLICFFMGLASVI